MKTKILSGQSLLDVVIQECGGMEDLLVLARDNGMGITDVLAGGRMIDIPDDVCNRQVAEFLRGNGVKPSTAGGTNSMGRRGVFSGVFSKVFG